MIVNDCAIVLARRDAGEYDRFATLLTESRGKVLVRFGGVSRPAGKLKAFAEPMTCAEYRLYFSPRTQAARCVGGRLLSTFPALREDLARTFSALSCCEMAARLLPERQPAPVKYRLLLGALEALDAGASPWVETAFGLRLLEAAGYGLRELPVPPEDRALWGELHERDLRALAGLPWDARSGARLRETVYAHVEAHAERGLRARVVAEQAFSSLRIPTPC